VEKVFSLNGLADMLIDGLGNHDNGRVLVVILVATILVRIGSMMADTLLYFLNPKYGQQAGL
jgi:ABC-type dipeptide/oligopeptide/nickel transport system permease component